MALPSATELMKLRGEIFVSLLKSRDQGSALGKRRIRIAEENGADFKVSHQELTISPALVLSKDQAFAVNRILKAVNEFDRTRHRRRAEAISSAKAEILRHSTYLLRALPRHKFLSFFEQEILTLDESVLRLQAFEAIAAQLEALVQINKNGA